MRYLCSVCSSFRPLTRLTSFSFSLLLRRLLALDWIEIQNTSPSDVNLEGWQLTNDRNHNETWVFPSVNIPSQSFLVVYASGKDNSLHTNFKLKSEGGYVGLLDRDGKLASRKFLFKNLYSSFSNNF